jgi:peroxiredoxin
VDLELRRVGGGTLNLSHFRGKPLVILFFATWCLPCQLQAARLHRVRAALGGRARLGLLGISVDHQPRLVRPFVEAAGFNFPSAYGYARMVKSGPLGAVRGVPRIVVLDAAGRVAADYPRIVDERTLRETLKPLLR